MSTNNAATSEPDAKWPVPIINGERCTGCGLCVKVCPAGALLIHGQQAVVSNPQACAYTGSCELICPEQAIARPFQIVMADKNKE